MMLYELLREELQKRERGLRDARTWLDSLVGKRPTPDTRVKVSLSEQDREVIDRAARMAGMSRSEFMRAGSIMLAGLVAELSRYERASS